MNFLETFKKKGSIFLRHTSCPAWLLVLKKGHLQPPSYTLFFKEGLGNCILVPYNLDLPLRSPDCEDLKVEDDVHGVLALKSTSTVEVDRQSEVLLSLLPLSPTPTFLSSFCTSPSSHKGCCCSKC